MKGQPLVSLVTMIGVLIVALFSGDAASQAVDSDRISADIRQQLLFPSAVELDAGRDLAKSTCARCHGGQGISKNEELPHLAGQRAEYLYRELLAYKNGAREDESMAGAVKYLNDEALVQVAAYYASREPATVSAAKAEEKVERDPIAEGKAAAAACAGCHGADGNASIPGVPNLTGQHPQYLVAAMKAYKSGGRTDVTMKSLVASLSDASVEKIALYYALQVPKRTATPAVGNATAGQAAAAGCAGCHGNDGNSTDPKTPSLAGQDAQYLGMAAVSYSKGKRDHATMKSIVDPLSKADIDNVSAFYAAQKPKAPAVRKPLKVAEWAQRCDRCHGNDGNSTDPSIPVLAGQHERYLV
ncbi:MAG: c-type cytochrome, partial [Acidiferrobacterales bacterium]|nr:c-type cytochrome [Acidiferrobacterales bacterium]